MELAEFEALGQGYSRSWYRVSRFTRSKNPSGLRIRKNSSNKNAVSTGPQQAWLSGKQLKSQSSVIPTGVKSDFLSQLLPEINFPFTML